MLASLAEASANFWNVLTTALLPQQMRGFCSQSEEDGPCSGLIKMADAKLNGYLEDYASLNRRLNLSI